MTTGKNVAVLAIIDAYRQHHYRQDTDTHRRGYSATLPSHRRQPPSAMINDVNRKLPLSFEVNARQFDSRVQFVLRSAGSATYLSATDAVLALAASVQPELPARSDGLITPYAQRLPATKSKGATLRMKL